MKSILVIDDDAQFNKMLCLMLTEAGYAVFSAENGDTGMKIFRQETPDLVITDIYMPEKEGLETILELRTVNPEIKILVISGGLAQMGMSETFILAETFGASAVLAKPFDMNTILSTVSRLFES
ncbi:MAG: response regulator [Geobacter sp.]|nr:response regulator [Geobacter sp.]